MSEQKAMELLRELRNQAGISDSEVDLYQGEIGDTINEVWATDNEWWAKWWGAVDAVLGPVAPTPPPTGSDS